MQESKAKATSSEATSSKRSRRPKRDKWEGQNPVLVMREASKKAGFTFVEDPNHPIYNEGSSITFMGPTHHRSADSSTSEAGPQTSSAKRETPP
jgi:hypothetical protein